LSAPYAAATAVMAAEAIELEYRTRSVAGGGGRLARTSLSRLDVTAGFRIPREQASRISPSTALAARPYRAPPTEVRRRLVSERCGDERVPADRRGGRQRATRLFPVAEPAAAGAAAWRNGWLLDLLASDRPKEGAGIDRGR
jgi:hypothetical protein